MNLNSFAKSYYSVQFNGSLPVSLQVLRKTGFNRYELKVGHKKLNTKTLKPLKVGYRYWATFSQTREGMLSIGNLKEKPSLLQNEDNFFDLSSWDFIDEIFQNDISFFKKWILKKLENAEEKSEFLMLTSMLLALNEGIFHLPFKINRRIFLLQYSQDLNLDSINFYFAFDTLGSIKGTFSKDIKMQVLYEKSANLLHDESFHDKMIHINIAENLTPLWKGDDGLLDIKG